MIPHLCFLSPSLTVRRARGCAAKGGRGGEAIVAVSSPRYSNRLAHRNQDERPSSKPPLVSL